MLCINLGPLSGANLKLYMKCTHNKEYFSSYFMHVLASALSCQKFTLPWQVCIVFRCFFIYRSVSTPMVLCKLLGVDACSI